MNSNPNNKIQVINITAGFNKKTVIEGLNLTINGGERYCILGPSGHGKTTLLNVIAGNIENIENSFFTGKVLINDVEVKAKSIDLTKIGFVFQDLALFPNMTVFENIAFPLKIRKINKGIIKDRVKDILQILKILQQENSKIDELSGGQRQRVALGRTLIYEPEIILMDEPLKGLDHVLKIQFIEKLIEIQEKLKFTLVYVTHDREDAFLIGNKIALLEKGKIAQYGTPYELYYRPVNIDAANYFGRINIIELIDEEIKQNDAIFKLKKNTFSLMFNHKNGEPFYIGFRPEHANIIPVKKDDTPIKLTENSIDFYGIVVSSIFLGSSYLNKLLVGTSTIFILSDNSIDIGCRIKTSIDLDNLVFFDRNQNNINLT